MQNWGVNDTDCLSWCVLLFNNMLCTLSQGQNHKINETGFKWWMMKWQVANYLSGGTSRINRVTRWDEAQPTIDQTQCGWMLAHLFRAPQEENNIPYTVSVCVWERERDGGGGGGMETAEGLLWLHLKRILQQGDPPFLVPHPPSQTST